MMTMRNMDRGVQSEGAVTARLKWFNAAKGFGFVNPEDRADIDAFLHITTLQNSGVQSIGEGARILCEIEHGEKGAHVKNICEIIDAGNVGSCESLRGSPAGDARAPLQMKGTVKWYKAEEGFGFIVPEDKQKDVFVHKTCLDKLGIAALSPGQRVQMTFRTVPKGREVVSLEILP